MDLGERDRAVSVLVLSSFVTFGIFLLGGDDVSSTGPEPRTIFPALKVDFLTACVQLRDFAPSLSERQPYGLEREQEEFSIFFS